MESKKDYSLAGRPMGIKGRIFARLMRYAHKKEYQAVLEALQLSEKDSLLDVGCGSGEFMALCSDLANNTAGLDHSPEMVHMAVKRNQKKVEKGLAVIKQGDSAELPWPDESFNAASATGTFMFWPEPQKALTEVYRVLKIPGRLVISLGWNAEDGQDHTEHIKKHGIFVYSEKEMKSLLREAGFDPVEIHYTRAFMSPRLMVVKGDKA
jgi:SAM-dependent methyltransferase